MAYARTRFPLTSKQHESHLRRRICDAQERVANGDQRVRDVRMQTGEVVRYELLMRYGDTLIYAHGLTLYQVMDCS